MKLHKNDFDLFKYTEFARGQESIWGSILRSLSQARETIYTSTKR